jgi:hypothetical protein
MPSQATVLQHPAMRDRPVAASEASPLRSAPFVALALVAAGSVFVVLALFVVVVAAPLVAALTIWMAYRSRPRARRPRRLVRFRAKWRARALGLVVLTTTPRSAAVRAVRG